MFWKALVKKPAGNQHVLFNILWEGSAPKFGWLQSKPVLRFHNFRLRFDLVSSGLWVGRNETDCRARGLARIQVLSMPP